jgi:hypothetical protein
MNAKGAGKQYIERKVFDLLLYYGADMITASPNKAGSLQQQEHDKVVSLLVNFVLDIFAFKKARDGFSSGRKVLALDILSILEERYEIPEGLELCMLCLKSKKDIMILGACEFIDMNIEKLDKIFTTEFIDLLEMIISNTKDRSVAFKSLDIQINHGNMSEFGALVRMDEWKDKNNYW